MPDLHDQLLSSLQSRLEVARAAQPVAPYYTISSADGRPASVDATALVVFINSHTPEVEIRRVEALLRVAERHVPEPGQHPDFCGYDRHKLPCPDIRDLCAGEGIEVGDG